MLKFVQWNANSIIYRRSWFNLEPFCSADVIVIQESWLTQHHNFHIPNFIVFRQDRKNQPGGGLLTAVKKNISASVDNNPIYTSSCNELLRVDLCIDNFNFSIFNIYCPNGIIDENFFNTVANSFPKNFLFMGDMNAHHSAWGSDHTTQGGKKIFNWSLNHNITLLNTRQSTFIRNPGKESCIDLTFCSIDFNNFITWEPWPDPCGSDHLPIIIKCGACNISPSNAYHKSISWTAAATGVNNRLSNLPTSRTTYNSFQNIVLEEKNKATRTIFTKRSQAPWWNSTCSYLLGMKRKFFRLARKYIRKDFWVNYKMYNAKLKLAIKKAKNEFWDKTCNRDKENHSIYRIIKNLRSRADIAPTSNLSFNHPGGKITSPQEQANIFADQFVNNSIHPPPLPISNLSCNDMDINHPFTIDEINSAIKNSRCTTPGEDGISTKIFKHFSQDARKHLLKVFNDSWKSGVLPSDWTTSIIVPIAKREKSACDFSAYRPIVLTSTTIKLFERMILKRLTQQFIENKTFHINHFGFLPHKSCLVLLSKLHHDLLLAQKKKKYTILVSIDIKSAYDKVWHNGLLYKAAALGIQGSALRWIETFLTNRTCYVKWRNLTSRTKSNNFGVPQGSVLSPLLFTIFMNDIFTEILPEVTCLVYADDIIIYSSNEDIRYTENKINNTLKNILAWANKWHLEISPDKSQSTLFSYKRQPSNFQLQLNGQIIQNIPHIKILGLIFDNKLTWKAHLEYIRDKAFRALNCFKVVSSPRWGAGTQHLIQIACSSIRSIFDYGCQIFSASSPSNRNMLETIFNEAIRTALGVPKSTPIPILLAEGKVCSVSDRHHLLSTTFFIKQCSLNGWTSTAELFTQPHNFIAHSWNPHKCPLNISCRNVFQILGIHQKDIIQWCPPPPPWFSEQFHISIDDHPFQVKNQDETLTASYFSEFLYSLNSNVYVLATDASKTDSSSAIGIYNDQTKTSTSYYVNVRNSIFTSEAIAIQTAVETMIQEPKHYFLFSDSLSVISSIKNINPKSPTIILQLRKSISNALNIARSITLFWIPGHRGIRINEEADRAACSHNNSLAYIDWTSSEDLIKEFKNKHFKILENKLKNYANFNKYRHVTYAANWLQFLLPRRVQVLISKMRVRRLYLNDWAFIYKHINSQLCNTCNTPETTEHFLLSCTRYDTIRADLDRFLYHHQVNTQDFCDIIFFCCSSQIGTKLLGTFLTNSNRF